MNRMSAAFAGRKERWEVFYSGGVFKICDEKQEAVTTARSLSAGGESPGIRRMVEIRPNEMIVDELLLGTAMDNCGDAVFSGVGNALMKKFCEEIRKLEVQ